MRFKLFGFCLALALCGPASAQDMRSFVDDAGRTVEIPRAPQRIVSLHDTFITLPLIELGVLPVASLGRQDGDGAPYIRSARMLTGVDLGTSDIAFLGTIGLADAETILAHEPDLILASTNETNIDQLAQIAPTIQFDTGRLDKFSIYTQIADITGTSDRLNVLEARYRAQIDQLVTLSTPQDTSIGVIGFGADEILVYHRFGSIGQVLHDSGFLPPPHAPHVELGQVARDISFENLIDMDADLLIVTYRAETGETRDDVIARLEAIDADFCTRLAACRSGNMIAIPRDETFASSYFALGLMAQTVLSMNAALSAAH